MIDPVERCDKLVIRFQKLSKRFQTLKDTKGYPCSLEDVDSDLKHIEGNEDLYEGAYWLEDWLFSHGV